MIGQIIAIYLVYLYCQVNICMKRKIYKNIYGKTNKKINNIPNLKIKQYIVLIHIKTFDISYIEIYF